MNTRFRFFFRAWRPALAVISLGVIAYVLYFHNLSQLLPGYSRHEIQTYASASDWHAIAHNPVNAPYKGLVWIAVALGHRSYLDTRVVSALFGCISVVVFFLLVRARYSFRISFLSTVLFATSAGLLHNARLGTADIVQFGVLAVLGCIICYRRAGRYRRLTGYGLVATLALLWYVPGLVWFELLGLIIVHKSAGRAYHRVSWIHRILWPLLFLGLISPLIVAAIRTPHVALQAAGLPTYTAGLGHLPAAAAHTLLAIAVRSPGNPELWVGHAPLLSIVGLVLAAVGAYHYLLRERTVRSVYLYGGSILSTILISLGGVSFASIVPFVYLFVASGLHELLGRWLQVFPRNPVARGAGIGLICLMVFFAALYQTRSYFVAWPHSAATRRTFSSPQQ